MTWQWLGVDCVKRESDGDTFSYQYDGSYPNNPIFCCVMQYQEVHLQQFLLRHNESRCLHTEVLDYTRKGRPVELLKIEAPAEPGTTDLPRKTIFLTSRHHCGETMATYALEGILDAALEDSKLGRAIRRHLVIYAVPFVDKDGVVDGDQGKNRRPHDHARDYGDAPIYPEIRSIMQLLNQIRPELVMDLHCPWLYSGPTNERIYFVGQKSQK